MDEDEDDDEDRYSDVLEDYKSILIEFRNVWLVTSLTHKVSKTATNIFWEIAKKFFPRLLAARQRDRIKRKIPQFQHLRKKVYKDLPEIKYT